MSIIWSFPSSYSGIGSLAFVFKSQCCQSSSYLSSFDISDPLIQTQFWRNTAKPKMKILAAIFALVALASGFKIETKRAQLITLSKINQCGPDETPCPAGCCPMPGWFCCFDSVYCAATVDDCRFDAEKTQLMDLAKSTYCDDNDQLLCPNGWCCPEPDWFCCPDDWCSPTPADCP